MISKRTLEKWRKEALLFDEQAVMEKSITILVCKIFRERILQLTQELSDIYLKEKE